MASNKSVHSTENAYPLTPKNRTWGQKQLMMVAISTTVATWCFLEGGLVGEYLNAKMGFATFAAGCMIAMFLLSMAVIPPAAKYGIDSVTSSKPVFGNKGWVVALVLQYLSIIGWNATILIFFAKAATRLLIETGVISVSLASAFTSIFSVAAVLGVWLILRKGSAAIQKASIVFATIIILVGIWMIYMLVQNFGLSAIMAAEPSSPAPDRLWNYTIGLEIGLISIIAWWPYVGGVMRFTPKTSNATLPSMLGLGFAVPFMAIVGLFSILMIGDSDPTTWMVEIGGITAGSFALGFIAIANFGSVVIGVYTSSVGLRNLKTLQKKSWNFTILLSVIPIALVGAFIPDLFFNSFGNFLSILGVLFAPLIGIQIVDYFVFRKKTLDVPSLYNESSDSAYAFFKGWNPAGIISMVVGFFTYYLLLHPLTYESSSIFAFVTASLPTIFMGGLTYWVITKFFVIPKGKGGYSEKEINTLKEYSKSS